MADMQCTWGIIRTDHYEFVSKEFCTLPQLLEEVTALVKAWDDPSEQIPEFVLYRLTPEQRALQEEQTKQALELHASFKRGDN